ncbi:MAG: hypothetical protein LBL42_02605 [Tannerella sp.]|jgi:hypothetical protein|nr:hypothetical protein [Tannerella sp.]
MDISVYTLRGMVLCMNVKNKLSPRRHGEHGERHGGTQCFDPSPSLSPQGRGEHSDGTSHLLRALGVRKAFAWRPQRRNFVPQNSESPCPPCLRVDNVFAKFPMTIGKNPATIGKLPTTTGKNPMTIGKNPMTTGKFPTTSGKNPLASGKNPLTGGKFPTAGGKPRNMYPDFYISRGMTLCMKIKNKLSTRRHGGHGEMHGGTPYLLRVLCAGKEITRRPQRRNFVPLNGESPCPPCLRVDNLFSIINRQWK